MSTPIVECVANYSEARRPEVVRQIADAIRDVPGAYLLDQHSDDDHNRTVLTFAGAPQAVEEAAFQSIARAAELIDLDQHTGEHPRIGASDVVPFVPISGVEMADCVAIARRVGERVGAELDIPVYLYEEAATRPERKNLENIRRGQYERLKEEIGKLPEREPDFGPARTGKAGATVIGARHPLIAFNVYLTSDDVSIAKKIARAVRHSSGGLRYVKGLGMLVEGRAQVSMNLTNYKGTPVHTVVEFIRREAARYGVSVHHSELVGLIPEDALVDSTVWYTQMDQFEREQILERRLRAALEEGHVEESGGDTFLQALAADSPTPGGGSASAYGGAVGAALVAMVARLTIGRKKYAGVEAQMQSVLEKALRLEEDLRAAVKQDAAAFDALMDAYRLPKASPEEISARSAAIQAATLEATRVPLRVAHMAVKVMGLALQVVTHGNLNAISDGGVAAVQARAALIGAGYNVRINLSGLDDQSAAAGMLGELQGLEAHALSLETNVRQQLQVRGGFNLA